jgi:hypothetical protein
MSAVGMPKESLEALASLLRAIVPGKIADAPPGWSDGWQACCTAIEVIATREADEPEERS